MSVNALTHTAMLLTKGSLITALDIPMARSTQSIKYTSPTEFTLTTNGVSELPSSVEVQYLQTLINENLAKNLKTTGFNVNRELAESLYGENIYDNYGIPKSLTSLRLVSVEGLIITATSAPILKSLEHIEKIKIVDATLTADQKFLALRVKVETSLKPNEYESESAHTLNEFSTLNSIDMMPKNEKVGLPKTLMESEDENDMVTPFDVKSGETGIDYSKLINKFGCEPITNEQIKRIEKISGEKAHRFLRRQIFFSHRDLDVALNNMEKGELCYLYTGRGPSSESMHLGHLVPFLFTQYLQKTFNIPLVIQMTDDEKFLFRDGHDPMEYHKLAYENAKDIIACGFNPDTTLLFSDIDYIKYMYPTILKIQKKATFNQHRGVFGFNESDNVGKISFPCIQAAPSFSAAFPTMFANRSDIPVLIPMAIDQDPYFRVTRDIAPRLGYLKPSCIHSVFFPALQGFSGKMSSSNENSAIFLTDSMDRIKEKITRFCISGGGATLEDHQKHGADLSKDVAYHYLRFFLESDEELATIEKEYSSGRMSTSQVKNRLIEVLQELVSQHQAARARVTPEMVQRFMDPERESLKILRQKFVKK